METVDLIGYLGSGLVALSMLMNNIKKLRLINLMGAITFATYGFLIQAWPVFGLNTLIAVVDTVYLIKLSRAKDAFSFFVPLPDSRFLHEFLQFWSDDIERFFPDFSFAAVEDPISRLILRNLNPVGVFICTDAGDGVATVVIDYVAPGYRDFKNASFVYTASHDRLKAAGFHTFEAFTTHPKHQRYLRRTGFTEDPKHPSRFTRAV